MTRWPVDPLTFSKKNPSRANGRSTYIHPAGLAKIRQRTSEEIGNKHTNKHTNKRCSNYSLIYELLPVSAAKLISDLQPHLYCESACLHCHKLITLTLNFLIICKTCHFNHEEFSNLCQLIVPHALCIVGRYSLRYFILVINSRCTWHILLQL